MRPFAALSVLIFGGLSANQSYAEISITPPIMGEFNEPVMEYRIEPDVRVTTVYWSADQFRPGKPVSYIIYALPNGNTTEWTIGRQLEEGMNWRYDIQHIGAQTRVLREAMDDRNIVVVYLENDEKAWPAWRRKHENSNELIQQIVEQVAKPYRGLEYEIVLTGHSGGGSFTFGYLNGVEKIPDTVTRIAFLDSNYAYDEEQKHGEKLLEWLNRSPKNTLALMAYDERLVEIDGKRIVSETGGTYRSTHRMLDYFNGKIELTESEYSGYLAYRHPQIEILIHPNPENKILHTVMVGEHNGFIHTMTARTPWEGKLASLEGPRAYDKFVAKTDITLSSQVKP